MTALYTKFTALPVNDLYTALSGRLYHAEAPQGATFPFCVMYIINQMGDWSFTDTFEDVAVQFSIYTNESSASNIGAYWSYLTTLFDDVNLTIAGYSDIQVHRELSQLIRDTENNIWHYATQYRFYLQKS